MPVARIKALANRIVVEARPHFDEFMKYAKVELSPPLPGDFAHMRKTMEKARAEAKETKTSIRCTTVSEVFLNLLVAIEVGTWFYMGEVIGRRHLVGYKV